MTRPGIIRADTIDLQDQNSPSAQDHSRKPHPSGVGPSPASHQAAELRHVQEERHSEEEQLSLAWNQANGLSEEPPSDDDREFTEGMHAGQNNQSSQQNGAQSSGNNVNGVDHDMTEGESGDDMDDDMMDKISSSPSISDGGLFRFTTAPSSSWPQRQSSRHFTPPQSMFVHTPPRYLSSETSGAESSDGSSPFINTPQHLPLSLLHRHSPSTPTQPGRRHGQSRPNTPLASDDSDSSSPFTTPPAHYPLFFSNSHQVQSEVHHRRVVRDLASSGSRSQDHDEGFEEPLDHEPENDDSFASERRDTLPPLLSELPPRIVITSPYSRPLPPLPLPPVLPSLVRVCSDTCVLDPDEPPKPFRLDNARLPRSPSDIELGRQLLAVDDHVLVRSPSDIAFDGELLPLDDPNLDDSDLNPTPNTPVYQQLQLARSQSDIALSLELLPVNDPNLENVGSKPQNSKPPIYHHPELARSASDIAILSELLPLDDPKLVRSPSDIAIDCELLPDRDPLIRSDSDLELDLQLLPERDPLLDDAKTAHQFIDLTDDEEWETDSNQSSMDSFESGDFYDKDDDETEALLFPEDARFIDSGWGGECLRETEDIDFEFVYALHTFVATVEGQANAQKGDTMVLLDDSNSYWWLVRVVKDSTIGYLPAEHIETPTERLARLNKHRNVDLSQTMLGDTTEKSKNPLKKAMRRRNAKQVTFSAPTYVEPSDYEYSSDEEMEEDANGNTIAPAEETNGVATETQDQDEITTVAPLNIKQVRDTSPEKTDPFEENEEDRRKGGEDARSSDEIFDQQFKGPGKSRNGTVRNTDSFFRDESIETRKITLTPNILRDDSSGSSTTRSLEKERPSFDLLQPDSKEKVKEDKKKKDKKPGMLSGLFKRKEKKKGSDSEPISPGLAKVSGDSARESPSMDLEQSPIEKPMTNGEIPQRSGSRSKLQKSPTIESPASPTKGMLTNGTMSPTGLRPVGPTEAALKQHSPDSVSTTASSESTPRALSPERATEKPNLRVQPPEPNAGSQMLTSLSNRLRSPSREGEVKREKVKRAKQREALDVDSSPEEDKSADPFADSFEVQNKQSATSAADKAMSSTERLSESPVHITTADATPDNEPPALVGDSSSNSSVDELASLRSSPSPPVTSATITDFTSSDPTHFHEGDPGLSPSMTDSPSSPVSHDIPSPAPLSFARAQPQPSSAPTALAPPPPTRSPPPQPGNSPIPPILNTKDALASQVARNNSTSTIASLASPPISPPWSDAHLRAYLDDSSDIRDLLLVVHDTSGVVPVGPEHPLMSNLYAEERGKVAEMNLALDSLLGGWLARKKSGRTGKVSAMGNNANM